MYYDGELADQRAALRLRCVFTQPETVAGSALFKGKAVIDHLRFVGEQHVSMLSNFSNLLGTDDLAEATTRFVYPVPVGWLPPYVSELKLELNAFVVCTHELLPVADGIATLFLNNLSTHMKGHISQRGGRTQRLGASVLSLMDIRSESGSTLVADGSSRLSLVTRELGDVHQHGYPEAKG
jgi:hypothetical protein